MPRSKRSYEERIDEKDEEIRKATERLKQIQNQKRNLEKQQREKERKERTRRLIIIGGIAEKALGREFVPEDAERFEKFLYGQENRGGYYSKAMNVDVISDTQASSSPGWFPASSNQSGVEMNADDVSAIDREDN